MLTDTDPKRKVTLQNKTLHWELTAAVMSYFSLSPNKLTPDLMNHLVSSTEC